MQIDTIKPGCLDPRKLPAGHMQFHAMTKNGLIVTREGLPYNERGEPLPVDLKWLRQNNYHVPEVALKAMSAHLAQNNKPQLKQCSACAIELDMTDKFCKGCGQAQIVPIWQPGEGIAGAAKGLVDPDDPLASLQWLLNPLPEATRVTAEQMGPTAEDALRGLQDEGKLTIGQKLQGVGLPGVTTGVTTVAPNFGVTPVGTVEYQANIASQVQHQR